MARRDEAGFLGRGWAFPPAFDVAHGVARMVAEVDDIDQSLMILFQTRPGERVMHPTFGCRLQDYVFEPMNGATRAGIEAAIRRAILFFEPRIKVDSVRADVRDWLDGRLFVHLIYTVKQTNSRHNVVFPFYRDEGTLISEPPLSGEGG